MIKRKGFQNPYAWVPKLNLKCLNMHVCFAFMLINHRGELAHFLLANQLGRTAYKLEFKYWARQLSVTFEKQI